MTHQEHDNQRMEAMRIVSFLGVYLYCDRFLDLLYEVLLDLSLKFQE